MYVLDNVLNFNDEIVSFRCFTRGVEDVIVTDGSYEAINIFDQMFDPPVIRVDVSEDDTVNSIRYM